MPVIDTSVVLKWLFKEPGSDRALLLLEQESRFYAPDYLETEFLSGITKKCRAGLYSREVAYVKREQFTRIPIHLIPASSIRDLAFELASDYRITFYDALFLATAVHLDDHLVTADERLIRSLESTALSPMVLSLNNMLF